MLSIGALAERTGTNIETIRYYEKLGMLAKPSRTAGNQRRYPAAAVDRLRFIRHSRELGFPLEAIRTLMELRDDRDRPCAEADAIAREHLAEIERKIALLNDLKTELAEMVGCRRGTVARCRVIGTLSDHAKCKTRHAHA